MSYIRFFELFPDVAMKETRTIIALKHNVYDVPPGEYSLIEMYCDDEGCDCQRVFLNVVSSITKKSMAVITFGWESREFYTKWFTRGKSVDFSKLNSYDQETVNYMHGVHLNITNYQSDIASNLLKIVATQALNDKTYVNRLKQHYKMFRTKIDDRI